MNNPQPHHSQAYPAQELPESLRQVIWAVESQVQSPLPLITASVLSTMAIACQGLIDVTMPTGQVAPASLFFLTCAESGERKTATDRLLSAPILELQSEWAATAQAEHADLSTHLQIWEIARGVIEGKLKRALKKGLPCDDLKAQFAAHQDARPKPRQVPHVLHSDATIEALLANMDAVWPHAALVSDEGSGVLGGHALRHLGVVNQLWDGASAIRVDRKAAGSFTLNDARLSLAIMVQQKPLEAFIQRNNNEASETGFLSRVLVAEPASRQGTRHANIGVDDIGQAALNGFHARIRELLRQAWQRKTEGQARTELTFNPEATAQWLHFANWVENQLGPGGGFEDIRGFASKLTNHMSRLAALIHYFQGKGAVIDIYTTNCAISLAIWYADEFKRLFGADDPVAIQAKYGDLLWNWLQRRSQRSGSGTCTLVELYRLAPSKLRRRADLDIAINNLVARGMLWVFRNTKPAYVQMIQPLPQFGVFQYAQPPTRW